jgi:hypothetical protein
VVHPPCRPPHTWLEQPRHTTAGNRRSHLASRRGHCPPMCQHRPEHNPAAWALEIECHDKVSAHRCQSPSASLCLSNALSWTGFISSGYDAHTRYAEYLSASQRSFLQTRPTISFPVTFDPLFLSFPSFAGTLGDTVSQSESHNQD